MGRKRHIRNNHSKHSRSKTKRLGKPKGKRKVPVTTFVDSAAKRTKLENVKPQISSSDSSEEDNFSSLLSSLNVPVTGRVIDTDESSSESANEEEDNDNDELLSISEEVDSVNLTVSHARKSDESDSSDGIPNSGSSDEFEEEESDSTVLQSKIEYNNDPFVRHFKYELSTDLLDALQTVPPKVQVLQEYWPILGTLYFSLPKPDKTSTQKATNSLLEENVVHAQAGIVPIRIRNVDCTKLHVKALLHTNLSSSNKVNLEYIKDNDIMTSLQKELFSVINNYQDLYFASRNLENGEEVRFIYCLHAVNHILKTRTLVINHNTKLQNKSDVPDEFRDQGLVRPKVLILVPFKDAAYKVINMIMSLLDYTGKGQVFNKERFIEEFTGEELTMPYKNPRPEDYEKLFSGNINDNFRMGLSITRKSLKLFVDFYSADIIVASPLGLRMIIGAEGEDSRDYDFLASIEVMVMDQTEVFFMQNWDHILHIMEHVHLQPCESHGTDFSRVRLWSINGWSNLYRQTLVFSSVALPEINSLFNKKCKNYAGKVRVNKSYPKGTVCQVIVQVPQIFKKFNVPTGRSAVDCRFEFFIKKILPQFTDAITSHVLIYIPSYFDYVRIRNYFKREVLSFVQICEYSKESKIARARDLFYHNDADFLLYSERTHFFQRLRIKGIRHIIFYQPPNIPNFYSELCNLIGEDKKTVNFASESNKNVTVIYSKYDCQQLAALVGTERAARMLSSERDVHLFVSGE